MDEHSFKYRSVEEPRMNQTEFFILIISQIDFLIIFMSIFEGNAFAPRFRGYVVDDACPDIKQKSTRRHPLSSLWGN